MSLEVSGHSVSAIVSLKEGGGEMWMADSEGTHSLTH